MILYYLLLMIEFSKLDVNAKLIPKQGIIWNDSTDLIMN